MEMENKMISVIIPAYNAEKYIDNCLQSVLSQKDAEFEVIIVNDGSTDNTAQLCQEWSKRYENIVYIEQENQGQGSARNCGIEHAVGAWLVFLDADDELVPGALYKLQEMTKEKADIVCYEFFLLRRLGQGDEHICLFDGKCQGNGDLLRESTSFLWDKMFRKEFWIQKAIFLDNIYGEDLKAVYLLEALCKRYTFLREPLVHHYERENNLSSNPQKVMEIIESVEITLKEFIRRKLFEYYKISLFYIVCRQYKIYQSPDFCDFQLGQSEIICKGLKRILKTYFRECYNYLEVSQNMELILIGYHCRPWYGDMEIFKDITFFPELESFILDDTKDDAESVIYMVDLSQEGRSCRFGTRTDKWQKHRWEELIEEFLYVAYRKGKYVRVFVFEHEDMINQELFQMLVRKEGVCSIQENTPLLEILTSENLPYKNLSPPAKRKPAYRYWCKGEQYRSQFNENILNAWLMLKNQNKNFAAFFADRGYRNVAVSGMGYLGERFLEELENSDINVVYGIDRGRKEVKELPIYTIGTGLPEADVIVVTVVHLFFEIKYELEKWTDIPVLSLEEVIGTLLQDNA